MGLRVDVEEGLVLLAAVPYDESIVDRIRTLPKRRFRRESQDWILPARRELLRVLCGLIGELEECGIDVDVSRTAAARLSRVDVGRAMLRAGVIEIAGPYSERRLPALRALPERHFDAERKIWTVPQTRAGALAILALADRTDELLLTQRARRALQRTAMAAPGAARVPHDEDDSSPRPTRRSPVSHWRHFTEGPVFDNPSRRRIDVPGIGPCVRIRVNPRVRRDHRTRSAARDEPDAMTEVTDRDASADNHDEER